MLSSPQAVSESEKTETKTDECTGFINLQKKIRLLQKQKSYHKRKGQRLQSVLQEYLNQANTSCKNIRKEGMPKAKPQEYIHDTLSPDSDCESEIEPDDNDWASMEELAESEDEDEDTVVGTDKDVRRESGIPMMSEPKFVVFRSMLLGLFTLFYFRCKTGKPKVNMVKNGTMVTIQQFCDKCEGSPFTWRSQPFVIGKYPAGNILLSFGVLMAGASISKVLLVLRHMGLTTYSVRTYFAHQKKFLFPSILYYWERYRTTLINKLKNTETVFWCGDGRFDSMGHSAKYGAYSMFCCTIMKVVHFELLQANEVGSSNAMELEGAKKSFDFLLNAGLAIAVFVSDRHRGITKWFRQCQPKTKHFFDIWHVARSLTKQLLKACKEEGCEIIKHWMKAVRNHLYWCVTSTKQGVEELILAKWNSFMRHVAGFHENHPDTNFTKCAHDDLEPRMWIQIGTRAYDKLKTILTKTRLLNDVKKLSPEAQTSCLEGFHATLNFWHPKMLCFSWMGTYCRHVLAILHFNENLCRETRKTKDGNIYQSVSYPKFKLGEEVVREVGVPVTYRYVDEIKGILFAVSIPQLTSVADKYTGKIPQSLSIQFQDRKKRDEALRQREARKGIKIKLFPSAEEQANLQSSIKRNLETPEGPSSQRKKQRCCTKCHQPRLGHPRGHCPTLTQRESPTNSSESESDEQ